MQNKLKKPIVMWLVAAICCLLWGSAFPAIKYGYALLDLSTEDTPSIILFAGIRFFFAGVLTIVIFSVIRKKPLLFEKRAIKKISVLALFQTVLQYVFFYLGLAFTSGERGSVISGTSVFFAVFIAAFIFKSEKLKFNKIAGSVIGFIGVILVSLDAFTQKKGALTGEILIMLSSISYAFSSNFIKKYSQDEDPAMLSGWQFVLGGAVMTAAGFIFGGRLEGVNLKAVTLIAYLALLSALAYSLWSILLKYNDVSKVAVCSFMTPVFGYILSYIFSKDTDTSLVISLSALCFVAVGIIIVNYSGKKKNNDI